MRSGKLLTVLVAIFLAQSSAAQPAGVYPNRALTVVVPMAAGGTADLLARTMAPALSTLLGQTIVIENRVGANGAIGEEFLAEEPIALDIDIRNHKAAVGQGCDVALVLSIGTGPVGQGFATQLVASCVIALEFDIGIAG